MGREREREREALMGKKERNGAKDDASGRPDRESTKEPAVSHLRKGKGLSRDQQPRGWGSWKAFRNAQGDLGSARGSSQHKG